MKGLLGIGRTASQMGPYVKQLNVQELHEHVQKKARNVTPLPLASGRSTSFIKEDEIVDIVNRREPYIKKEDNQVLESDLKDIKQWVRDNRASLPRILFTIVCSIVAAYQCWKLVEEYLRYPTGVNVLVDEPSSMRQALPGLTVCDNNRFQMKYLAEKMKEKGIVLPEARAERHQVIQKFLTDMELITDWTPIAKLFDLATTADDFIKYLKCDQTWLKPSEKFRECEKIPIMESLQFFGKCFTLFHNLSTQPIGKDLGIERHNHIIKNPKDNLDTFVVRDIGTKDETQSYNFAPSEIVQLMVDFQPNQTTNVYQPVSGKVYIHDTRHIPGLQETYFDIEPGYYYEYYIRRVTTMQLPHPYDTNCTDYVRLALPKIKDTKMLWEPLTRSQCIKNCLIETGLEKCQGMWPPEAPYFRKNPHLNYANKEKENATGVRWGPWYYDERKSVTSAFYQLCSFMYQQECRSKCGIECAKSTYEVITTRTEWPFKEIIESATKAEMEEVESRKKCCAMLSIRYSTFVQTVRDFEPRFLSMQGFISGMGGLVSMWIGISVISLFDILDYVVTRLMRVKL